MRDKARIFSALSLSIYLPLLLSLQLDGISSYTDFEISVPTGVQIGVYGEAVLLSCLFPVSGSWEVGSSVITWQRNLEVVHSFFHNKDQPQYQSRRYANRTSLFHQDMKKGNASLRLGHTTLADAGEYTCSVSTQLGSQRKSFPLKVAALYPEPRLHISVLNDGHVEVLVTTEGGFPSPSLQWLIGNARDVTNETHTQLRQDQHTRLYSVNSKLNLSGTVNSSITFIMKNPDLDQEIRRNIDLFSENERFNQSKQQAGIIGLCVGVLLLAVIVSVIGHWMIKKGNTPNTLETNIESSAAAAQLLTGVEAGNPTRFITELLLELFGADSLGDSPIIPYIIIDRAHRSLAPKPKSGERPRAMIVCFHYNSNKEKILRLSRNKGRLHYKGTPLHIFPLIMSPEVSKLRAAFNSVKAKLRDAGVSYSLYYPARLAIAVDVSRYTFDSPQDAEKFVKRTIFTHTERNKE